LEAVDSVVAVDFMAAALVPKVLSSVSIPPRNTRLLRRRPGDALLDGHFLALGLQLDLLGDVLMGRWREPYARRSLRSPISRFDRI
jgi:hypothetical protein